MSESAGIDSFLERAMPKPYSVDLRARVIEDVESGASRREAAERYGIRPSVVVIWVQRFEQSGGVAAKPSGGSISPLEQHAEFLLGLIAAGPDAGRDRRGDAQTPDRRQPQRGVAVLSSPQHQPYERHRNSHHPKTTSVGSRCSK